MVEMTSRERVIAALQHREPDRVPLDIGGGASTSIVVEGYELLKRGLGISSETRVLNKIFRVARLDEAVLKGLGSDCYPLTLKPSVNWKPPSSEPGSFVDIWGLKWREVYYEENCFYYECVDSPLKDADIDGLDAYPWPDPNDPGYTRGLADEAKELFESTDYALVGDAGFKSFWELGYLLRGYDRLLMDIIINPAFVSALLSKLLEINTVVTGRFLDAVGPYIQVFRTADDMATQNGLLISPESYRKLIKPIYKRYYDLIRLKTDAKIFYHSCGNVTDLLDVFIDNGLDIINPVQVSAMKNTAELKNKYGDRLVFWGGIDTQHVLLNGRVEDVEAEVRLRIRDLGPGGGYVAAAVHNIQPDVSPRNIIAMTEAVKKYGRYPLTV